MPKSVSESLGLYRERLHPDGTPDGTDGWWDVTDVESARVAVEDMVAQLDRAGWPVLESMFSRKAMMSRLHHGDLGMMNRSNFGVFFARAEALLLMDAGPSDALESQLDYALSNVMLSQRDHAEQFRMRGFVLRQPRPNRSDMPRTGKARSCRCAGSGRVPLRG